MQLLWIATIDLCRGHVEEWCIEDLGTLLVVSRQEVRALEPYLMECSALWHQGEQRRRTEPALALSGW